jgi:hypothetical protein
MSDRYGRSVLGIQLVLVALFFVFKVNALLWTAAGLGVLSMTVPALSRWIEGLLLGFVLAMGWCVALLLVTGVSIVAFVPMMVWSRLAASHSA